MRRTEMDCRDVSCVEVAKYIVQWRGIVNKVLNFM
jgi:hypothetical protein